MDKVFGLIINIRRDIDNYLRIHNLDASNEQINEVINEVIKMSGISIGENEYLFSDVVEAINLIIREWNYESWKDTTHIYHQNNKK